MKEEAGKESGKSEDKVINARGREEMWGRREQTDGERLSKKEGRENESLHMAQKKSINEKRRKKKKKRKNITSS